MIYCYDKRIIINEDIIKEINNVKKNTLWFYMMKLMIIFTI